MKIALDEHIAIKIAKVFDTLSDGGVLKHSFCHASKYVVEGEGNSDVPWLNRFADDGGEVVITGDIRMRSNPHERQAFLNRNLILYMLPPKWSNLHMIQKSAFVINAWHGIEQHIVNAKRPSCWQIENTWTKFGVRDKTGPT